MLIIREIIIIIRKIIEETRFQNVPKHCVIVAILLMNISKQTQKNQRSSLFSRRCRVPKGRTEGGKIDDRNKKF